MDMIRNVRCLARRRNELKRKLEEACDMETDLASAMDEEWEIDDASSCTLDLEEANAAKRPRPDNSTPGNRTDHLSAAEGKITDGAVNGRSTLNRPASCEAAMPTPPDNGEAVERDDTVYTPLDQHEFLPAVMDMSLEWREVWCPYCHGNSTNGKNFADALTIIRHANEAHKENLAKLGRRATELEKLDLCTRRQIRRIIGMIVGRADEDDADTTGTIIGIRPFKYGDYVGGALRKVQRSSTAHMQHAQDNRPSTRRDHQSHWQDDNNNGDSPADVQRSQEPVGKGVPPERASTSSASRKVTAFATLLDDDEYCD